MSWSRPVQKNNAATKRGGRGPKRPREGTAMTTTTATGQRFKSFFRPGQAPVGRFQAHPHGMQVKLLDQIFSGAYNAGLYTPDTQPLQQLPINSGPSANYVGATQCLNLITQGTGEANRLSNKISLKSIRLRLAITATGKTATGPFPVRVVLYYDRNPGTTGRPGTGAYKSFSNVMSDFISTNAVQIATTIGSSLSPTLFDQIVILKDQYLMLPAYDSASGYAGPGPTVMEAYLIDWYVPLKDLEAIYNQTQATPAIADIQTGALCIAVCGEAVINNQDAWQLRGTARLRFKDN